jgi:hypothetical protein
MSQHAKKHPEINCLVGSQERNPQLTPLPTSKLIYTAVYRKKVTKSVGNSNYDLPLIKVPLSVFFEFVEHNKTISYSVRAYCANISYASQV